MEAENSGQSVHPWPEAFHQCDKGAGKSPLRWERPRLPSIPCEKPSWELGTVGQGPRVAPPALSPPGISELRGSVPLNRACETQRRGAQAEKEPRAAGGQAGSERLCSAFFFLPLSLLSSFSAAQAEPGCSELTIIAASRQCLVGGLLLCACRPPRGSEAWPTAPARHPWRVPTPLPLCGCQGPLQSVCLLIQLGVHLCPSPTLGSTLTLLCSILWPKVQKQDTVQALVLPEACEGLRSQHLRGGPAGAAAEEAEAASLAVPSLASLD